MKNLLIYPSDYEGIALLRNLDMLGDYSRVVIISLNGSGQIGHDVSIIDKGEALSIKVESEDKILDEIDRCDDLLLLRSNFILDLETDIIPLITYTLSKNKKVICDFEIPPKQYEEFSENKNFIVKHTNALDETIGIRQDLEIYSFQTPIIFFSSLNERSNKLSNMLTLKRYLNTQGFKVSCILSDGNGELLDNCHSYPSYMFEKYNEIQKIYSFNRYIKNIEQKDLPDIIFISVPGASIPFNKKYTNYFGVQTFLAFRAVTPDAVICCLNYSDISPDYLTNIKEYYETSMAATLLGFIMNNVSYDSYATLVRSLNYVTVDPVLVNKEVTNVTNIPLFSSHDRNGLKQLSDLIINHFSAETNPTEL